MKLSHARQINKSRELGVLLDSSLMKRRILYSCMALMNPVVPEFENMKPAEIEAVLRKQSAETMDSLRTFNIDLYDFAEVWNLGGHSVVDNIKRAIGYKKNSSPEIMKMGFRYVGENGDLEFINVISKCTIKNGLGAISIVLTDSIVPFLINLASYSQIPFRATLGFKSNYSFTMLEFLLKRYTKGGNYPIETHSIEELHDILLTGHIKSYARWIDFKKNVLDMIEKDFKLVDGGGYTIKFTPIFSKKGRGRPSVSHVEVTFDNSGIRRFQQQNLARKAGLDYLEEDVGEVVGRIRIARKEYNLKKEKEMDLKRGVEYVKNNPSTPIDLKNQASLDFREDDIPF